jgi:hypothetical protein
VVNPPEEQIWLGEENGAGDAGPRKNGHEGDGGNGELGGLDRYEAIPTERVVLCRRSRNEDPESYSGKLV